MRILLTDDSVTMCQLQTKLLKALGYSDIVWAHSAEEAIRKLDESIGLVLLDWHMPGMTGLDFLQVMKHGSLFKDKPVIQNIPVIMVTSEKRPAMIMKALKAGAKAYVKKPFTPAVLQERIQKVLGVTERKKGEKQALNDEFKGTLNLLKVPEIIQFLSLSAKTGVLEVASGGNSYKIYLSNGKILNAEGPDCEGADVVYKLASATEGTFSFQHSDVKPTKQIGSDTTFILLESLRRVDEERSAQQSV